MNPQIIHLTSHHRSLPHFQTLPVLKPQVIYLTYHRRILPQIYILHQVTLPLYIPPFLLYQNQPQFSRKPSTRLKCLFTSSMPALLIHLQPNSPTWSHWRCLYKRMLTPIPLTYLIPMCSFWKPFELLVQHIKVLLQDYSMYPITMPYPSPDTSSFPTPLPSEIPSQGPTSVTTSTHRNFTSDLPSTL